MRYNISTVLLVTDSLRAVAATSKYGTCRSFPACAFRSGFGPHTPQAPICSPSYIPYLRGGGGKIDCQGPCTRDCWLLPVSRVPAIAPLRFYEGTRSLPSSTHLLAILHPLFEGGGEDRLSRSLHERLPALTRVPYRRLPRAASARYEKLAFKHLRFHNSSGALSRLKHGAPSAPAVEWLGGTRFREPLGPADFTPQWALDLVAHHPDLEEFASIEFMSRCDAFVGPLADEMMRLAYQLAVARKGWFPPFVSNDGPLLHAQPPPSLED